MFQTPTRHWPRIHTESRLAGYPATGDDDMSGSAGTTPGPRVLVVDDEEAILDFVELGLRYEGFEVELAKDGPAALTAVSARRPDLILLDLNLPGLDGLDVCRRVRQVSDVPIIMLTARGDVDERVEGLEAGADDYLPKPFKFKELLARVRAVLRRRTSAAERVLKFGAVELNRDTREVFLDGRPVHLTPRELDLLEVFMLHPRQVMTREVLRPLDREIQAARAIRERQAGRAPPPHQARRDRRGGDRVRHDARSAGRDGRLAAPVRGGRRPRAADAADGARRDGRDAPDGGRPGRPVYRPPDAEHDERRDGPARAAGGGVRADASRARVTGDPGWGSPSPARSLRRTAAPSRSRAPRATAPPDDRPATAGGRSPPGPLSRAQGDGEVRRRGGVSAPEFEPSLLLP